MDVDSSIPLPSCILERLPLSQGAARGTGRGRWWVEVVKTWWFLIKSPGILYLIDSAGAMLTSVHMVSWSLHTEKDCTEEPNPSCPHSIKVIADGSKYWMGRSWAQEPVSLRPITGTPALQPARYHHLPYNTHASTTFPSRRVAGANI